MGVLALAPSWSCAVLCACGGDEPSRAAAPRAPTPTPTATPVALDAPTDGPSLALGITEPNPNLIADRGVRRSDRVGALARRAGCGSARRSTAIVVPWSVVAAGSRPGRPVLARSRRRVHARQGAVRAVRRHPRPAAGARRARLAGDGGDHRHAAVGGAHASPGCRRSASSTAAGPRASRCPRTGALIAQVLAMARDGGRRRPLRQPLERAQPPVLPRSAARGLRRRARRRWPPRRTPRWRAPRQRRARRAARSSCSARPPASSSRPRARPPCPSSSAPCRARLVCSARVWSQHAYIGGTDPVAAVDARARRPRLPAPPRDLDHRDRRRPGAGRPLAGARDHQRAPGLPAAAPPARRLVREPARDAGRPVHVPRGRPVPDRARHDRPQARPAGAARVAGLGRRPRPTPAPPRPSANEDSP